MDDLPDLMARGYGFRSQGKSAPMSASRSVGANAAAGSDRSSIPAASSSSNRARSGWDSTPSVDSLLGDHAAGLFRSGSSQGGGLGGFDDVFGGPPKYTNPSSPPSSSSSSSYHDILDRFKDPGPKSSSMPKYDKPRYDDDMFDGLPGLKSSSSAKYENVFDAMSSSSNPAPPSYDDLLGNLGRTKPEAKGPSSKRSGEPVEQDMSSFDDLLPGFGGSSLPQQRGVPENDGPQSSVPLTKPTSTMDEPFVVLESTSAPANSSSGSFTDPIENINVHSGGEKLGDASVRGGVLFDDIDGFDGFPKSVPSFTSEKKNNQKDQSPHRPIRNMNPGRPAVAEEPAKRSSVKMIFENTVPKTVSVDGYRESHETLFDMPTNSTESVKFVNRGGAPTLDADVNPHETNSTAGIFPETEEHSEMTDDVWLTVSEIPLFTPPTSAPPPSRPPPPLVIKQTPFANRGKGASAGLNAKRKVNQSSSSPEFTSNYQSTKSFDESPKTSGVSPIDELENFAKGKSQAQADKRAEILSNEKEIERNSAAAASAAAMKEAMDRAEAKFKHAREVREREGDLRSAKTRESIQQGRDEKALPDAYDRDHKEEQQSLDRESEQREREENEKEQKRLEKERERELERERERAREAVERATREARERAIAEARRKAERAAVEKAQTEARERSERAAVQRATAEARDRAAAGARERAERAVTEARERTTAETRERAAAEAREKAAAERAAVERAAAEARLRASRAAVDRATAEARERAAAVARDKQQKNENDLDSFFGVGARANSAPRQRTTTTDPGFDTQVQNKGGSDGVQKTSVGSSSSIKKPLSTMNIVDDLTSIFGAVPSSGEFQEIEGESEERRRARLERNQRTLERAAKALAEKNERDMQTQRDQAERNRIGETLDVEIKRWSAGKEGNLRALLSTLQYVLWPECGWQPVSLTDLIIGASVKKVYRKATLCIHPDKVQQKGANLQQKYIAEKVFDLLKEAWNKFNSEELF